jgi:hypothetical protein
LEEYITSIFRVEERAKKETSRSREQAKHLLLISLLGSSYNSEDGGNIFLQSVRLSPNYTVFQPRICALHSHHCENHKPNTLIWDPFLNRECLEQ